MSTNGRMPKVVACVPTYNAARFVTSTLRSLAEQTYPRLEVLISDDASTDETVSVCEQFAKNDPRFIVRCNSENLGWIRNSNTLVQSVDGDYCFRAGHDDVYEPQFVERLIAELESNDQAVLAFSDERLVTGDGSSRIRTFGDVDDVADRLVRAAVIARRTPNWSVPGAGIVRADVAKRVGGLHRHLGGEIGADWPWLLSLATLGEFVHVREALLNKFVRGQNLSKSWKRTRWKLAGLSLSAAGRMFQAPLPLCERARLQGNALQFGWRALTSPSWSMLRKSAIRCMKKHVPRGETLILVDDNRLLLDALPDRTVLPFVERETLYWGPPADDRDALRELDRLQAAGASYMVFCWPAFWWLDHYRGLHRHLRSDHRCIAATASALIFRLR